MNRLFQIVEEILRFIPGTIFGLLSVFFALTGILISLFSFPGYDLLQYDVSFLALGPYGLFFNLGLILSGIIALPFHFYMYSIIGYEEISLKLKNFALILSVTSSLTLSLIGFFPVLNGNIIILIIHGILALITFLGITIYCFLYGLFFLKNTKFSLFNSILSFSVSSVFIFYFTNRWSLIEWIGVGCIMLWIVYNAVYTLFKKI